MTESSKKDQSHHGRSTDVVLDGDVGKACPVCFLASLTRIGRDLTTVWDLDRRLRA